MKKEKGILLSLVFLMITKPNSSILIIKLDEGKKLGLILDKGKSRQVQIQENEMLLSDHCSEPDIN